MNNFSICKICNCEMDISEIDCLMTYYKCKKDNYRAIASDTALIQETFFTTKYKIKNYYFPIEHCSIIDLKNNKIIKKDVRKMIQNQRGSFLYVSYNFSMKNVFNASSDEDVDNLLMLL